jgi:hypothetical protein
MQKFGEYLAEQSLNPKMASKTLREIFKFFEERMGLQRLGSGKAASVLTKSDHSQLVKFVFKADSPEGRFAMIASTSRNSFFPKVQGLIKTRDQGLVYETEYLDLNKTRLQAILGKGWEVVLIGAWKLQADDLQRVQRACPEQKADVELFFRALRSIDARPDFHDGNLGFRADGSLAFLDPLT